MGKPGKNAPLWVRVLTPLASLRLTVGLLTLSMVLVFVGTWAQIDRGIWWVQKEYFHSFWARVHFIDLPLLIPGGYTVGGLLLINLVAAHAVRMRLSWRRSGVILIHLGLILLLVGELCTSLFAVESQMRVTEGEAVNFTTDLRRFELALVEDSADGSRRETVVPATWMEESFEGGGDSIGHEDLPVQVAVTWYAENSTIIGPQQVGGLEPEELEALSPEATQGVGRQLRCTRQDLVSGTEGGQVDLPSAVVKLSRGDDVLGTWLVSPILDMLRVPLPAQTVSVDGRTYTLSFRFKRYYKPYWVFLEDFRFDRYTGTEKARNFSSDVTVVHPELGEQREVRIYMNHPLRYEGETFYQSSFDPDTERTTVLQVVRNPVWTLPYLSVAIGALGMMIHFGATFWRFARREAKKGGAR